MLRLQLELSQAKGELERKLQEKEEETEAARYRPVPSLWWENTASFLTEFEKTSDSLTSFFFI